MNLRQRFVGISAVVLALALTGTAAAGPTFLQDFETDTSGWLEFGGTISQVASGGGSLSVTSAGGSTGHAEVVFGPSAGNGSFTRFGGYSSVWPGFIRQSLDVYIDPNAGSIGDGWYLDNAVNGNDGAWEEAGGVGVLKATDGNWWLTADADGASYQGPPEGGVGLEIDSAGWYTIVSEWVANVDGLTVDRNTYVYDDMGSELYSNLNLQQVDLADIGGHRYGWIAFSGQGNPLTLAIDNSSLETGAVPEPASLVLLGLGAVGIAGFRRRRSQLPVVD